MDFIRKTIGIVEHTGPTVCNKNNTAFIKHN